ncbi:MAG: signal recognition particle-docking protein FtsY [Nitrospirae bacterium]|nr:MAG: signal recognition particle-docking protein FtsY [Nitrospirota bacterium]
MNWLQRLQAGLEKTRKGMTDSLKRLLSQGPDPQTLEDLEVALLRADVGVRVVDRLLERLKTERGQADPGSTLREMLLSVLRPVESDPIEILVQKGPRPFVLLAVGVNGVGKTTTLAKLGSRFRQHGMTPLLVAADTFRAAAIEQLAAWGTRVGIEVVHHQQGADPAAVVFDGLAAAKARGVDVVLIDTAGRLHTKMNLMDELRKMKRVIARELPRAPHEILLIVDGTLGQNTLVQARQFHEALGVTGLAVTKLDGTARCGVLLAIADELRLPIRLIGVGETEEDLQDFDAEAFVDALLGFSRQ